MLSTSPRFGRTRQRGLSLVELLVGVAVGLIVVAGATLLVSGQLIENRRLLVETQLQQDLRAAMDIITRELRRVGTQEETTALTNLWYVDNTTGAVHEAQKNTFSDGLVAPAGGSQVDFAYQIGPPPHGPYGFKLVNGIIQTLLLQGGWQDLTDGNVMEVRTLTITPVNRAVAQLPCAKECPGGGGTTCWPTVQVRELQVAITARAKSMPGVDRTMSNTVRLRTDHVRFDPAIAPNICPA